MQKNTAEWEISVIFTPEILPHMKLRHFILTALCATMAQAADNPPYLLPRPHKVAFGTGVFRTDQPYSVENHTAFSMDVPAGPFRLNSNSPKIHFRRIIIDEMGHFWSSDDNKKTTFIQQKDNFSEPKRLKGARNEQDGNHDKMGIFAHDEAYRLHVGQDTIHIGVNTPTGLLRALQTLSQLADGSAIPAVDIADAPAYEWRGVMIDLSRHLFPLADLKRQVDIAASFKLNRLHLHLTDAGGWRLQLEGWPLLTERTARRTQSDWQQWWIGGDRRYLPASATDGYGGFYTKAQMRELIDYAAARGMQVVPEIEMPGHSEEVLAAYPELGCVTENDTTVHVAGSGDLCLGNPATYRFLERVMDEVMDLFPPEYIHIGGDEAGMAAWRTCPRCQRKLKALGATQPKALQTHLIRHMAHYLYTHGRKLLGWDEITDCQLPNTTVMVWRDAAHARKAIAEGMDVVMAPCAHCYYNNWQDAPIGQHADLGYLPLEKAYALEPDEGLTADEAARIKGVQGCVWTEFVETTGELECYLYPRLMATAEIGWNGQHKPSHKQFRQAASTHIARLRAHGINAFDLSQEIGHRPESRRPIKHLAYGAAVTYNRPFSPYYPAAGNSTLTDGLRGDWSHGDQRWQGFIGPECIDFCIDLGRVAPISRIGMDFVQNASPYIYLPATLTISVSTDGQHFRQLWQQVSAKDTTPGLAFHTWAWQGADTARYIRIQGSAHDADSWIFTDEVVVE